MECLEGAAVAFRNFNVCPHCRALGEQPLLSRLSEAAPMISRSDGSSFHLLLADRPLPYPNEIAAGPSDQISVCFWYSHVSRPPGTHSTVVTLSSKQTNGPQVYRAIEVIADNLAETLARHGRLMDFYNFTGELQLEMSA